MSFAPFAAASAMRPMALSIEASRSRKTGAAWMAAARYLGWATGMGTSGGLGALIVGSVRGAGLPERRAELDWNVRRRTLARMSRTISTHAVDTSRRLAFWTDLVCDTYVQLRCDAPPGTDVIDGEIVSDELATLQLSRVTATAQLVRRTPDLIARASEDHFLVSIQTQGRGVVSQD